MICSRVCTKNSSSPLENSKQRGNSKSCKSCGGRLLVGGREAQRGSMLSNGGLELSRVINPHLTWKTASNGRQRAVRRARTSFTWVNGKNSTAESLKVSKDLLDQNSKSMGDMTVSESEKVGVCILGRRFSDNLGSIPIKKRRFSLVHSPSSLHHSSLYFDDLGHVVERPASSHQDTVLNEIRKPFDSNMGSRSEFCQEGNLGFEGTDLHGANEKICDAADFSGISILAAAACDCNIGCELMNVEGSLSKARATEVQGAQKENGKLDLKLHTKEEPLSQTSEDLIDRTDLPFEASSSSALPGKESNEVKFDGSVSSFQNFQNKTEVPSSHDAGFPWDLNNAIDAWDSPEEVLNCDREATTPSKDADHNEQLGTPGLYVDEVRYGEDKNVPTDLQTGDSRNLLVGDECEVFCASEMKTKENIGIYCGNLAKDSKESKSVSSLCVDTRIEEKHLKDAKKDEVDGEETKTLMNKDKISIVSGNFPSPVRGAVACAAAGGDFLLSSDAILEEGKEERGSSFLVSCENAAVDPPTKSSGSDHGINNGPIEVGTNVGMAESTHAMSPQTEKHRSSCVDFLACAFAEKGRELLVDVNTFETLTGAAISGSNAHTDVLNEIDHDNDKCVGKDAHDCETIPLEMMTDMTKMHVPIDDVDAAKHDFPANFVSDISVFKSSDITSSNANAPTASSSHADSTSIIDDSASNPVHVALKNHFDCCNCPDASQNYADQAIGMEKVEFLGDDDSQFEDGEFRESLAGCWLDDEAEDEETEHVDYGSDRDTDIYEAASNLSSVIYHVNNVGQPNDESGKGTKNDSQSLPNHPSPPGAGAGNWNSGSTLGKGFQGNLRTATEEVASEANDVNQSDGARKPSHSVVFRKMSGWDRLPGSCRNSESRLVSGSQNHNDFSSDPSSERDSINRGIRSSSRRDLASRMGRVHSSDISCRNDRSHDRPSRLNDHNGFNLRVERLRDDHNGFNPRVERLRDDPPLVGRSGSPLHLQGRVRGDRWVDSFSHHGNSRRDSSGFYGPRNAAASAVAKVESKDFIVAPGGRIVKAGGAGSASDVTRQSINASSPNTHRSPTGRGLPFVKMVPGHHSRERSPDRSVLSGRGKFGRYGRGMDSVRHRERYNRPMSDDIINSPSSLHPTISRRESSFSPICRRPFHLSDSRSRSRSRSRTQSPIRWASPRGRSQNVMNGGPGLWWRSRSPNFNSEARMDRPRAGFRERVSGYASLSRSYASPPHASRWIDGRKEMPDHLRDFDYKHSSGRSPPGRVFSRGHRLDLMVSERRPRPNEYRSPSNSGRFKEFVGFSRGFRNDGKVADRREHDDRYETLNSLRRYVNGGNVRRYDGEIGFMAHNVQPNSSVFQRRDSLRAFDRDAERHFGDSPRRSKYEKGLFRNGNDGYHDANFTLFSI